MAKRLIPLFLGLILIVGCSRTIIRETTVTNNNTKNNNWAPITLRAIGGGAPPANAINAAQARLMTARAAKMDAYRNLLEEAYGVNISGRSYTRDFITKSDTIKARVDAYIRGADVVNTIYHDDGGVEVEMEITLSRDFRNVFPE